MKTQFLAGAAASCLALCLPAASAALAGEEDKADPRIGDSVNQICFQRNIRNWRAVEGEDNVVLLEENLNDWYRVELIGACRYRDLRFTQTIALASRPGGGCVTRGDVIVLLDNSAVERRCTISGIHAWDEDAEAPEDDGDA